MVAGVPLGVVPAINARAGPRIADVRMSVAVTPLAVGEVPKPGAALVTLPTVSVVPTFALACGHVAEVVQGTDAVTVAR